MSRESDARLDALAVIRLIVARDTKTADAMVRSTANADELAAAACSLAAAILRLAGDDELVAHILGRLTVAAATDEGGAVP